MVTVKLCQAFEGKQFTNGGSLKSNIPIHIKCEDNVGYRDRVKHGKPRKSFPNNFRTLATPK